MTIKFENRAQNFANSRGLPQLSEQAKAKIDANNDGTISLEEAAQVSSRVLLNSDSRIDTQEHGRIHRLLGLPTPVTPTTSIPSRRGTSHSSNSTTTVNNTQSSSRRGTGFQLSQALLERHDEYDQRKLKDWSKLINENQNKPTQEKLHRANAFFNSRLMYASDQQAWRKSDYWATPVESLAKGGGDCDDFAIAKYVTLRKMGIPKQDLKLAYVYYKKPGRARQAHMVLLHQPNGQKGTVLDNINKRLKSIEDRKDLRAVYTFNEAGLWSASGDNWSARLSGTSEQVSKWQGVVGKMRGEGIW